MTATATIQSSLSINRNIVECKVVSCETNPLESLVLIETLWNVKLQVRPPRMAALRINRNIVECKELSVSFYAQHCLVLIETLWNVKLDEINRYSAQDTY